jgi:5-(carboxyamino)imidazole ribonucleotide mutase
MEDKKPVVAIIMGSDSDWPTMTHAAQMLADFNVDRKSVV